MGEVKRYWARDLDSEWQTLSVTATDYARLERERDELKARNAECEAAVDQAVALCAYIESAAKGAMVERIKTAMSSKFAQERAAELTRLRAVEADYAALQGFMRDRMPALIAARLAADDGYDPEDQHGGLYDLRWSGGPEPEPQGDAWSMDYLPRGEKIAADLAEACGRKG